MTIYELISNFNIHRKFSHTMGYQWNTSLKESNDPTSNINVNLI